MALPGVRMEQWIIDNQVRYRRGVFLAMGDAFTLLSGRRSFALPWMQRMGLTWAYRLYKEPLRLGPRYLRYNFSFVSCLLWDIIRGRAWEMVRADSRKGQGTLRPGAIARTFRQPAPNDRTSPFRPRVNVPRAAHRCGQSQGGRPHRRRPQADDHPQCYRPRSLPLEGDDGSGLLDISRSLSSGATFSEQ